MKGAFLISREIFQNGIWNDVVKFRIFFYLIGNAMHSKEGVDIAGITLQRGQYLRSLRQIQQDLSYKEGRGNSIKEYPLSTIQRKIKSLVNEGRIEVKSTEYGTLFTVLNYAQYQGFANYRKDVVEQLRYSSETSKEQHRNNNNNVNNVNNEKNDNTIRRKRVYNLESSHYQLADRLYKNILVNDENFKTPNLQVWAEHIRLMIEIDKRTENQIAYLIDWVQKDSFWKSNILSTKKLREKATQLIIRIQDKKGATIYEDVKKPTIYADGINF